MMKKVIFKLLPLVIFLMASGAAAQNVSVIELRDYLIKQHLRDKFIDTFRIYIEDTQNARGAHILAKYSVKNEPDHFYWIRGFENMNSRKNALEGFYNSAYWAKTKRVSAGVVINFDNVHLLKPLDSSSTFDGSWFRRKGVTIVDVFIANGRRNELIEFFKKSYDSVLTKAGFLTRSYWIAEDGPNTYPVLPMFQDTNLVAVISIFQSEREYVNAAKKISGKSIEQLNGIATLHHTIVLFPVNHQHE